MVTKVAFQQFASGHPLDDLILHGVSGEGNELTIDYQSKRTLAPIASDSDFVEALTACIQTIRGDPDGVRSRRRRLGLAAAAPVAQLAQLQKVVEYASSHNSVESFRAIFVPGSVGAELRNRWSQLSAAVAAALTILDGARPADEEVEAVAWQIAADLEVWIAEVEGTARDAVAATDRLGDVFGASVAPASLFGELRTLAESWGPKAGSVDVGMLRAELDRRGIQVGPDRGGRQDFSVADSRTVALLDATKDRVASNLHLPRTSLRDAVASAIKANHVTLITGKAGAGKSVITCLVARELRVAGDVVLIAPLAAGMRPVDLDAELGYRLEPALAAAPTGRRRVLIIDGGEQSLSDAARLLKHICRALPREGRAPIWELAIVTRDEALTALRTVLQDQVHESPEIVRVDDLTDEEVSEVLHVFPQLRAIARHPRPSRLLLRRPYLVDLLARTADAEIADGLLGEEDVIDIVQERLIRRDGGLVPGRGTPPDRADVFLALADAAVAGALPARLDGLDGEARVGLAIDDVITRERNSYRFAHDVLTDLAVAARLLEPDGTSLLLGAPEPRRLIRAIRLAMQHWLVEVKNDSVAVQATFDDCTAIAEALASSDGERWLSLPMEAVLHAGPAAELLQLLLPALLDQDGRLLGRLVDVALRLGRRRATVGHPPLDLTLSAPVVQLIGTAGLEFPRQVRSETARLIRLHLTELGPERLHDLSLLPNGREVAETLNAWFGDATRLLEDVLAGLALLAPFISDTAESAILDAVRRRAYDFGNIVDDPACAAALASYRSDLLLRLAGCYYVNRELFEDPTRDTPIASPAPRGRIAFQPDDDEGGDGVRNHANRVRYGEPLAGPRQGPFASLLTADSVRGRRLVGAVVDQATRARVRVEAQYGGREFELAVADRADQVRVFRGTDHVWRWYRGSGVGAWPAMSALMALRQWALAEAHVRPLSSAVDQILQCGDSIAFPAVAYSVILDNLEIAPEGLDRFLEHPLVWHLEIARVVHEASSTVPVPDESRLRWQPSQLAGYLVVTGTEERRQELKRVGDRLLGHAGELVLESSSSPISDPLPEQVEIQVRRWATELDIDAYRARAVGEQQLEVSVELPEDVRKGLQEGGGRTASLWLELQTIAFQAMQSRDGTSVEELASDAIVDRWNRVLELIKELRGTDSRSPFSVGDALAATAATIVRRSAAGYAVEAETLQTAVGALFEVAEFVVTPPNPVREMKWDLGADRSAASCLPLLLFDSLYEAAGVGLVDVRTALLRLAGSPYEEVRSRLAAALHRELVDAPDGEDVHAVALAVMEELVATSGYGPWSPEGYRPHLRLPEPIEESLDTHESILDVGDAGDAIDGLVAASSRDCEHGARARNLLRALAEYDRRVWPRHFARFGFAGLGRWRAAIDAYVAGRALSGSTDDLWAHLNAFANVAEDSQGVLSQLALRATTIERAIVVHDLWPRLMDGLLPATRNLRLADDSVPNWYGRDREEPSRYDVELLDQALLLSPPQELECEWPWERTAALLRRWAEAFASQPNLADRLIDVLVRLGWLGYQSATQLVLQVLGEDAEDIQRGSRAVIAWLRFVLVDKPQAVADKRPVRTLLDRLAAAGSEGALALQQQLES